MWLQKHQEGQVGKAMGGRPANSQRGEDGVLEMVEEETKRQLGRGWDRVCRGDPRRTEAVRELMERQAHRVMGV